MRLLRSIFPEQKGAAEVEWTYDDQGPPPSHLKASLRLLLADNEKNGVIWGLDLVCD